MCSSVEADNEGRWEGGLMKKRIDFLIAGCLAGLVLISLAAATPQLFSQNTAHTSISSAKSDAKSAEATELRIRRIGNAIDPVELKKGDAPVRLDIEKLMKLYNVPGLSVAVIEDYRSLG